MSEKITEDTNIFNESVIFEFTSFDDSDIVEVDTSILGMDPAIVIKPKKGDFPDEIIIETKYSMIDLEDLHTILESTARAVGEAIERQKNDTVDTQK